MIIIMIIGDRKIIIDHADDDDAVISFSGNWSRLERTEFWRLQDILSKAHVYTSSKISFPTPQIFIF